MKGTDKILKLRLVQLPGFNMLIVKCKMLTEAPRLKLVLFCRDVRPAVWGQGKLGPILRLHPVTAAARLLPILNMKQTISRSIILYRYPK